MAADLHAQPARFERGLAVLFVEVVDLARIADVGVREAELAAAGKNNDQKVYIRHNIGPKKSVICKIKAIYARMWKFSADKMPTLRGVGLQTLFVVMQIIMSEI